MPRGRGRGFRGGAGGGGRGRGRRPDVPWSEEQNLQPDYQPSQLFPEVQVPTAKPLSQIERLYVARFRSLRDRVHEGPLYTVLGDDLGVGSGGGPSGPRSVAIDPFEGMPTYSQKYRRKTRRLPRLDTRPYVLRFFPTELWSTLDPEHEIKDDPTLSQRKKTLRIAMADEMEDGLAPVDLEQLEMLESSRAAGTRPGPDDDDGGGRTGDGEAVADEEEEQDDDYEDDEEDLAGDYRAEGYFDNGADDEHDDYDGDDHEMEMT